MNSPVTWDEPNIPIYGPRNVQATSASKISRNVARVMLAVVLILGGMLCRTDIDDLRALQKEGKVVSATVVNKRVESGKSQRVHVDYRVSTPEGGYTDTETLGEWGSEGISVGGTVQVTILPGNFTVHRYGDVDQSRIEDQLYKWLFGTIGFGAVIEVVYWFFVYETYRHKKILASYLAAPARITAVGKPTSEKVPHYSITFEYLDCEGDTSSETVSVESSVKNRIESAKPLIALVPPEGGKPTLRPMLYYAEIVEGTPT